MPTDEQLEALLDRWSEAETTGTALTPAELCRDTPELLPEFEHYLTLLNRFESLRSDEVASTMERASPAVTLLPDQPTTHGKPATPPATLPAVGAEFDGYRIVAELGRGGMGCVFRVTNLVLKRDEALKVILPEVAVKPEARKRFLREAQAMAGLRHDHVVEVYHVREAGGIPYLAMPLLAGETLADRLKREKTLPAAEVVRIGLQMAEGLAAHARGLIHRDIKPGNVWLEAGTNRVKLLDFGLVHEEGSDSALTGERALLGTPPYMSPEQVDGAALDGRSDLFSVGSVLYECATGRRAFPGATLTAVLFAVAQDDPPAARAVNAHVPAALSDLLRALLHKNPEQRPASALELVRRLRLLESSGPAVEETASTGEYKSAPPRRRRWPWLAAAGCVLVLGLVGGITVTKGWFTNRPLDNRVGSPEPKPSKPTLTPSPPTEPKPSNTTPTPSPAVEPLRVLKIEVHHTARTDNDIPKERGLIGDPSLAATLGDQVTIEAKLSRPAYAYLIAFNPNGTFEQCFPDPNSPDEPPPLTDRPRYPMKERTKRFGFTDGDGLMVFAVVASDTPLPSYREWAAQSHPAWRHAEGTPGEVWWDDGELLDTLTSQGRIKRDRGTGAEAEGLSSAVVRLSDSLKLWRPNLAVGSIGFAVKKR